MVARNQRVRDTHVGAKIAPDHHVMTGRKSAFRTVMTDG